MNDASRITKQAVRETLAPLLPEDAVISLNGCFNEAGHSFEFFLLNDPDEPQCWELADRGAFSDDELAARFAALAARLREALPGGNRGMHRIEIPKMRMRATEDG